MSIIYSDDSGPLYLSDLDKHDPQSKQYYYLQYFPETRVSTKEYIKNQDVIIPVVSNGCLYECVNSGISGATAPTFTTTTGSIVEDGTVKWRCKTLTSKLLTGDTITTSTWTTSTGVTVDNPIIIDGIATGIRVTAVPLTDTTFTLTNHIIVTRASTRIEEYDKSIVVQIGSL